MKRLALAVVVAGGLCAATPASADRPHGIYVVTTNDAPAKQVYAGPGPGPRHRILWMNRNGGTYTPGNDDSSQHISSIPNTTSTLSPFPLDDASWQQFMVCVKSQYAPFDIEVTDVRPVGDVDYVESAVGGTPEEVGMGQGVGGVSPIAGDCSVIERATAFTFAGVYGNDVRSMCETAAQESGHAFGMDHEFLCEDPMTYLYGCGNKTFQNKDVSCGENSARTCRCGQATQNSVAWLTSVLGAAPAGDTIAPDLTITAPANGATVTPSFAIAATASDNKGVTKVELRIDGTLVNTKTAGPWQWTAPTTLGNGAHSIEVRAYDAAGNQKPATVSVTLGSTPPAGGCQTSNDCTNGDTCVGGTCMPSVPPGGGTGGMGTDCTSANQCLSGLCVSDGSNGICTTSCTIGGAACADGYTCTMVGANGVCWPSTSMPPGNGAGGDGGSPNLIGGCTIGASSTGGATDRDLGAVTGLALALAGAIVVIRRRGSR